MNVERQIQLGTASVPTFMYGTAWKEDATQRCVRDALTVGFRAIDTANQRKHYFEAGVGAALKDMYASGLVKREELFLQTKFTHIGGQDARLPYDLTANVETQVRQSFASSLEHLHTDYIDSYVLHGPSQRTGLAPEDLGAWRAMEEIYQSGKAKLLGVSNVNLDQLDELFRQAKVKPSFVQNRCYASTGWNSNVRQLCAKNGVRYQGFSLLTANSSILTKPGFAELLLRYKKSAEQIIFRFALQIGIIPITGTTKEAHMRHDLQSYDFEISPEDVAQIENMGL